MSAAREGCGHYQGNDCLLRHVAIPWRNTARSVMGNISLARAVQKSRQGPARVNILSVASKAQIHLRGRGSAKIDTLSRDHCARLLGQGRSQVGDRPTIWALDPGHAGARHLGEFAICEALLAIRSPLKQ
jgi:hypothetical protein